MQFVTTAGGWAATARSLRWSPVVTAPLATCVALVLVRAVGGPVPRGPTLVGDAGLAFTASAAAFTVEDPALAAAPATPVPARLRLVARAVLLVPVTVSGWLLVAALDERLNPAAASQDLGGRALISAGMASAALGIAALAAKRLSFESPGAVGVGSMACLVVVLQAVPATWLDALPPAKVWSPATAIAALVAIALTTKEPVA